MSPPKAVRHLTPAQFAEREQVSVETVKYWRRIRYGPKPIKVGRHPRYRLAEIEAWEEELLAATG